MKNLKLALVVPNCRWCEGDESTFWHFIPFNLCLLAAMIEDICNVKIIDSYQNGHSEAQFLAELKEINPDIVGISVLFDQFAQAGHISAKLVKSFSSNITVIMGGVYVTVNPETVMQDENIDYAVVGEGEYVLRELIGYFLGSNNLPEKGICYRLNGNVINKGQADFIHDLDAIPLPAYHLIDYKKYSYGASRTSVDSPPLYPYARIMSSRGCPHRCVFCQAKIISGRKFRARSANNVLKEITWLKKTYDVQSLIFDDDDLFANRKRAFKIFQGMIDQGLSMPWKAIATAVFMLDEEIVSVMRESGCQYICIAIESGCKRVLKEIIDKPVNYDHARKMVKIARKSGIYVAANFIIGFPTETWDEIRQTIRFAEELEVDYIKLFHAIPLRHTRLWDLCIKEGAFKKGFDQTEIRWNSGQIETEDFSSNDLTVLSAYECDRINFSISEKRTNCGNDGYYWANTLGNRPQDFM